MEEYAASPASAPTPPLGQQSKFMPSLDGSTFVPLRKLVKLKAINRRDDRTD
jgi:hypothetical protein